MPTYVAKIRDSQGKSRTEKFTSESLNDARTKLRNQGFVVQELKESQSLASRFDLKKFQNSFVKVSVKDKAVFSRQFAALVNAGVAIVRGLTVLSEQCSNPKLKAALVEICADVQTGVNLSDSMRKHPDCFDGLYVSMVQAGEIGGVLDEVLNRLAKLLEDMARLQNQIKSENNNNYENYNNKKINIYIVATNLTEPYRIPLSQVDPRNIIADAMYDKFSLYNTELYYFYLQYRKEMDYKTFLVQWDKIKTETKSECPRYVNDFITSMNRDSKRGKIKDLDSIFVSELNMALKDSISDFLGL
jgi:hypothetical protein